MRLPTQEDVVLWASALLFVAMCFWVFFILTGCANTTRQVKMKYSKTCTVEVIGNEVMSGRDITSNMNVGPDCDISRDAHAGEVEDPVVE